MKKKAFIYGLVGTMIFTSFMQIKVVAEEVEEVAVEAEEKAKVMSLSLEKAVEYALENSKDMEIQKIELQKSEVAYKQNIKAIIAAEKASDVTIDVPRTYEVTADDNVNRSLVSLGVSRKSVELAYQIAKWNLEMKENQIEYNVEKAYFDLLQMEKELNIALENLNLSKKQYEMGKKRLDVGVISEQQLLGLEMGLLQAQNVFDSTKMYLELQLMSFQNTLGLPFNQDVSLTDTIDYKKYEPINIGISIEKGLKNNTGIKTAKESYEISELTLKAVSGRFPENTYKYREQAVEVAKAAKNLETAKNGVEMSIRSAYLNLLTAEKQIITYEKTVEQAQKAVLVAELSFELGQNTATEVTQANISLMNAKSNLNKQIHAFNMALLDYEYSIGIGKGF